MSQYGFIIVCPDGQDSWYFDSPVDPKMQFETYVSQELVAYIDSHYRTYANRYMRAITGLSMGGHGSLFLAFRHPDVFWSCGSMSGCMDITKFPEKWHIKDRLGEYASNKQSWQDHAVCNQIDKVKAILERTSEDNMSDSDIDELKAAKEALMNSSQAVFSKMYEQMQGQPGAGPDMSGMGGAQAGPAPEQSSGDSGDDDVVDADFREV